MDFYEKEVERIYQELLDTKRQLWGCELPDVIKDNLRIDVCIKVDTYRRFLKLVLREGVSLVQVIESTKLTDC